MQEESRYIEVHYLQTILRQVLSAFLKPNLHKFYTPSIRPCRLHTQSETQYIALYSNFIGYCTYLRLLLPANSYLCMYKVCSRDHPRFFDHVGHQTTNASSGNTVKSRAVDRSTIQRSQVTGPQ